VAKSPGFASTGDEGLFSKIDEKEGKDKAKNKANTY